MNTELLKQRICVVRFDAYNYNRQGTLAMPDADLIETAENDTLNCIVHDTLPEFQADFNDGETDWNDCYMKFCVKPFQPMQPEDLEKTFSEIKEEYHRNSISMSGLLATIPADCMSLEQAAMLYMKAMNWANSDEFYIKRPEEELEQIEFPQE